jgi:hypothetical protein
MVVLSQNIDHILWEHLSSHKTIDEQIFVVFLCKMAADLPSWKRLRVQMLIRSTNHIPNHSEEMRTKAHDLVFEYVNSDSGPDVSKARINYPKSGFGQRQLSDGNWFRQVWQYCRLPHDMSEDIGGRTELDTRPDSETFLTRVQPEQLNGVRSYDQGLAQ